MASKLSDSKYHNWIEAGLALLITKEGIEPFVKDEIQEFQLRCLSDICYNNGLISGTTCSSCCTENVVVCPTNRICNVGRGECSFHRNVATRYNPSGCPNKICDNFRTEIQKAHRYYGPSFRNTDASQWCSNTWEVAKCFMPPDGYSDVTSAADTDFNGIFSVVLNHKGFQAKLSDNLSKKKNIFEKAKEKGKAVRHSPNFEISDSDLQGYFTDLQNLLLDASHLAHDQDAQNARQKLSQLQNNTLPIGEEQIKRVIDSAAEAIKEKIKEKMEQKSEQHMKQIDDRNLELLKESKAEIKELFGDQQKHVFSNITNALSAAKDEITKCKTKALEHIEVKTNDEEDRIKQAGDEQVERVARSLARNEDTFNQSLKDLHEDLINHYRSSCNKLFLSPLTDDAVDVPLLGIYVPPFPLASEETSTLKSIGKQAKNQQTERKPDKIDSLRSLCTTGNVSYRNIYLTAEPGFGKSSFVNWLLLNWCQARDPIKEDKNCFSTDNIDYLKVFDFVFVILLRDMEAGDENIEQMIKNHLIEELARKSQYTTEFLEQVLCRKECLVILDGLDEWTTASNPKSVPARPSRQTCSYITTSRPWKFATVSLDSSQIDRHVKIQRLQSTIKLVQNMIKCFKTNNCLGQHLNGKGDFEIDRTFYKLLDERKLSHLSGSPVILMQLLYLWNFEAKIGNSRCGVYTDMVELMLARAKKKGTNPLPYAGMESDIADCFKEEYEYCQMYSRLLLLVGKLAFLTLFNESKESSIVFTENEARKHLFTDSLDTFEKFDILEICVKNGLLYKETHKGVRKSTSSYSFFHKTIQEYFAALYIQSRPGDLVIAETVKKRCDTVSSILEMESLFIFLSGFNPNVASSLLQTLLSTVSDDEEMKRERYREHQFIFFGNVRIIQNMIVYCVIESRHNGHNILSSPFPLQDIIISADDSDSRLSVILNIIQSNTTKIKSFSIGSFHCIGMYRTEYTELCTEIEHLLPELLYESASTLEVIQIAKRLDINIDFSRFEHLQKLTLSDVRQPQLQINGNLKTLRLDGVPLTQLQLNESLQELKLSNVPVSQLQINDKLKTLSLTDVPLTQLQLNESLQELKLSNVSVSQLQINKQLKTLSLVDVPLTQLQLNGDLQVLELSKVSVLQLQTNKELKTLSVTDVPLTQLQLNEGLQKLTLSKVSVSQLQINEQLKTLSLIDVPLTQLQLNEDLQVLELSKVSVLQLQTNKELKTLSVTDVPLTQLQLNEGLQKLTLSKVSVSQLQTNKELKTLSLTDVPLTQLQLNENLQELELSTVSVSQLQTNEQLNKLRVSGAPLTKLQLNEGLHKLCLYDVPLTQLQLNESLQELSLSKVPVSELQINEKLKTLSVRAVPLTQLQLSEQLEQLGLLNVPISDVRGHFSSLGECHASDLPPCAGIAVLRRLPSAPKLHSLACGGLKDQNVIYLLNTFPKLLRLEYLELSFLTISC